MRTIVYVDGYNLFYSCLKNTPFKWLDLRSFFEKLLHTQSSEYNLLKIKYFTADIKARFASHGDAAVQAQRQYHRALTARGGVDIIKGYYVVEETTAPRCKYPPDKTDRVPIWRLEEKQTDVNMALHMYRDALRRSCDQIVLCSNDTDLVPVFELLQEDFADIQLAVIIPRRKDAGRPSSGGLSKYAAWTRHHILDKELEASQFSTKVPTRKKPAIKPDYW